MQQRTKDGLWALGLTALMVIVGLLRLSTPLPKGQVAIELAGIIGLSSMVGLNLHWGAGITTVATIILILLGKADWMTALDMMVDMIMISALIGWQLPRNIKVTHRQAIGVGVAAGISQWITAEVLCGIAGDAFAHGSGIMPFMRLALPTTLLTALLYMLLIPPLSLLIRHFNWQPPKDGDRPQKPRSMVIDLSDHQGMPKKQDDHHDQG